MTTQETTRTTPDTNRTTPDTDRTTPNIEVGVPGNLDGYMTNLDVSQTPSDSLYQIATSNDIPSFQNTVTLQVTGTTDGGILSQGSVDFWIQLTAIQ